MTQFVSTPVLSSHNPHLLDQVRESVLVPLAAAFVQFQDALAEALFRPAADADVAQNDVLEAIHALWQRREPITARFFAGIRPRSGSAMQDVVDVLNLPHRLKT
ncbi:DUF1631 family protein [Xanthomonas arboricola]|uniref:DUF1631 family protein n=1 Tax=Xanthomonas arboricola TaxID=56448 RepID=UPI000D489725|nr:DUF1631 family protein [Xanthomonas arboricola]PPU42390.1 hypothetical protein XaplCFBP3123_04720 [Xanthomonas arboricola pv. populi]